MKFISLFENFSQEVDTEDIENIFIPVMDLGYKFEYTFINGSGTRQDTNTDRFIRSLGTEFLFDDTSVGNEKLYVLRKIGEFMVVTLDRDFTSSGLYKKRGEFLTPLLEETEFNIEHKNEMIEVLEEVEDRIEGMGYQFFNNFYSTSYSDDVTWVRIHYFIFKPVKFHIDLPEEEFNFRGSN